MKYTYLGNTGMMVSKIAIGTMRMDSYDKTTMFKVLEKALDVGINHFDTADMYGRGQANNPNDPYDGSGKHSETLGEWIKTSKCRDEMILSSKVRWPLKLALNYEGLSRRHIIRSVNKTLELLNSKWLDILYFHGDANNIKIRDVLKTMDDLQSDFKFNYLGTSNMNAYRIMEAIMTAQQNSLPEISVLQTKFSLLERSAFEREHQYLARDMNLGVLCYGVLSEGFLTGLYQADQVVPNWSGAEDVFKSHDNPRNWAVITALNDISEEQGVKQGQVAIAWTMVNEYIDSPLLGVSSIEQLEYAIDALDILLTQDQITRLNEVSKMSHPWWSNINSRSYIDTYQRLCEKYQSP